MSEKIELGRGRVFLNGALIGDAQGLKVNPETMEFKDFRLGSVTKARNVTISFTGLEYTLKNLRKTMPEVFRAMRQLNHAISKAMGRKPFYRRRRTRSMRGK